MCTYPPFCAFEIVFEVWYFRIFLVPLRRKLIEHIKTNLMKKLITLIWLLIAGLCAVNAEFKDFSVIVNNQSGTLLTADEMATQGNAVSFGVAVDNVGNVSRVAVDDPSSVATISGNYHSDHGLTNFTCVVAVPGDVKITFGNCTYSTNNASFTPEGGTATNVTITNDCWKNNHDNVTVAYYTGEATTLTIRGSDYTPYLAVESTSYVPNNKTVTFSLGEEIASGVVPVPVVQDINASSSFTIPKNTTLYKEGYTLTGWTDGTTTYAIGQTITLTDNLTLTPVFTSNGEVSLASRTDAVTVMWNFRRDNGCAIFALEGNSGTGFIVTQADVDGTTIDVKMDINATSGKFNNTNNADWVQVNSGTIFTFPSVEGASVTAYTNNDPTSSTTVDGNSYSTYSNNIASFTATSTTGTSVLTDHGGGYYRYVQVVLPATSQPEPVTVTGSSQYVVNFKSGTQTDEDLYNGVITVSNGSFHDASHGYQFTGDGEIRVQVAGEAYIRFELCEYGNASTITMYATDGVTSLGSITTPVTSCGQYKGFHYTGAAGTIMFRVAGGYVHGMLVQNVSDTETMPQMVDGKYNVTAGSGADFKRVLSFCNLIAPCLDRAVMYLPNGTYDLGSDCRTEVQSNVAILGESMAGVIIQNTPASPGIQATSTLRIVGDDVFLQKLTLKNNYNNGDPVNDGVAVALEINGNRSICNNVQLQSNQDTYYSNVGASAYGYFKGGRITGTVDYVCGDGNIWFEGTEFYNNARVNADVIFAPSTNAGTAYGYVANNCFVNGDNGQATHFNIARPWQNSPAVTLINTTFNQLPSAAGYTSMNGGLVLRFHEYNSKNASGNAVTEHNLTACSGAEGSDGLYLTGIGNYNYETVLGAWNPEAVIAAMNPVATVSGTITASGFNTFSSNYPLDLSTISGGTAYVASEVSEGKVVLTKTTAKVAGRTGLFIAGTPETEFTINTTSDETTLSGTNLFVGLPDGGLVDKTDNSTAFNYVFGWSDVSNPGFYKVVSSLPTLSEGKAYLHTTTALSAATRLVLSFDDEATGIAATQSDRTGMNNQKSFYNLNGQRVSQPAKGIYISNGKKVIIK